MEVPVAPSMLATLCGATCNVQFIHSEEGRADSRVCRKGLMTVVIATLQRAVCNVAKMTVMRPFFRMSARPNLIVYRPWVRQSLVDEIEISRLIILCVIYQSNNHAMSSEQRAPE